MAQGLNFNEKTGGVEASLFFPILSYGCGYLYNDY